MYNEMYLNEISLEKVAADDYFINGLFRLFDPVTVQLFNTMDVLSYTSTRNKKDIHNTEMFTQITQLRTQNNTQKHNRK